MTQKSNHRRIMRAPSSSGVFFRWEASCLPADFCSFYGFSDPLGVTAPVCDHGLFILRLRAINNVSTTAIDEWEFAVTTSVPCHFAASMLLLVVHKLEEQDDGGFVCHEKIYSRCVICAVVVLQRRASSTEQHMEDNQGTNFFSKRFIMCCAPLTTGLLPL